MMRSITNVIFGLAAVFSGLIGLFWIWFLYEFSLKWEMTSGLTPAMGTAVNFGRQGAWWIGSVAAGWFILALLFFWIHRRQQKRRKTNSEGP